jgi:hypothetical protein
MPDRRARKRCAGREASFAALTVLAGGLPILNADRTLCVQRSISNQAIGQGAPWLNGRCADKDETGA